MKIVSFVFVCSVLFPVLFLFAEDPAKGHYESALLFLKNRNIPQAIEDLNVVVKSFPESPYADDALLQMGLLSLEQGQTDEALSSFKQIKDNYPSSDSAPAAYYYLGKIHLNQPDAASQEEALADFRRVARVYPDSKWVAASLVGAGTVFKKRGKIDEAWNEFAKVRIRFADSPEAAQAQYEMGVCSLYGDHHIEASREFQQVVQLFPDSEYAKAALDMNTLLYRLHIAGQIQRLYSPVGSYSGSILDLDEPSGMSSDSKENVYVVDKGKKLIYVLDPSGKITNRSTLISPYSVSTDQQDRVLIANDTNVVPFGKDSIAFPHPQAKPEGLGKIRSAATDDSGRYFVVSENHPGILVYDQNKTLSSTFAPSTVAKEYHSVLVNSRNEILLLDKDRKQLSVYSTDGKLLFIIGPAGNGFVIDRIEDFAVDRANHIYLLEKKPRSVMIFSAAGEFIKNIASEKNTAGAFEDAKLITVGPSGAIYLLDKDQKRILKLG